MILSMQFQEIANAMSISMLVGWPNQHCISSILMDHPMEQIHFMHFVTRLLVRKKFIKQI